MIETLLMNFPEGSLYLDSSNMITNGYEILSSDALLQYKADLFIDSLPSYVADKFFMIGNIENYLPLGDFPINMQNKINIIINNIRS